MGKNTKPILTILIDEEKRDRLRTFAESKKLSMGKLINQLIDRAMDGDIDIHSDTSSTARTYRPTELISTGIDRKAVEELVEGIIEKTSVGISKETVEEWVKVSIEDISVGLDRAAIEELIEESIARHVQLSDSINKELIERVDVLTARLDAIEVSTITTTTTPSPAQIIDDELGDSSSTPATPQQYTALELGAILKVTGQAIGKWRDSGKLTELGYRAEKVNNKNWVYYAAGAEQ